MIFFTRTLARLVLDLKFLKDRFAFWCLIQAKMKTIMIFLLVLLQVLSLLLPTTTNVKCEPPEQKNRNNY